MAKFTSTSIKRVVQIYLKSMKLNILRSLKRKIIFILSSDEEDLDEEVSVVNLLFSILSALFN